MYRVIEGTVAIYERVIPALEYNDKDGNPIGKQGLKTLRSMQWKVWCNA